MSISSSVVTRLTSAALLLALKIGHDFSATLSRMSQFLMLGYYDSSSKEIMQLMLKQAVKEMKYCLMKQNHQYNLTTVKLFPKKSHVQYLLM